MLGSAVLFACASGTANGAGYPPQKFFHTPGFGIECELRGGPSGSAYCQTIKPERSVTLNRAGKATICNGSRCVGNGPENAVTLGNEKSISLSPFTCTDNAGSVSCMVGSSGFVISKSGISRVHT